MASAFAKDADDLSDMLSGVFNFFHAFISFVFVFGGVCILALSNGPLFSGEDCQWHIGAVMAIAFAVFSGGFKKVLRLCKEKPDYY